MPVGRIGRPHGVRGEVTIVPDSDDAARFALGSLLTLDSGRDLTVASVAPYRDKGLIVRFEGVSDRDDAETLRGETIYAPVESRRPLDDGEFWPDDLIGLDAHAPDGTPLGSVAAVEIGTAQDRLVIRTADGRDIQVPFVDDIVGDPVDGRIEIRDPGGLF